MKAGCDLKSACDGSDPSGEGPEVSVIVCAYNVASYIADAVRSALAQQGVTVEVIVSDDASTDGTADIVAALADRDPRVVLLRRSRNSGQATARNDAIARARGRWLAILDGDDTIDPARSRLLIDLAEASGAEIVADNYERVGEDGRPLGSTMMPVGDEPYALFVDLAAFVDGNVTFRKTGRTFGAIKQLYRADFLRAHGLGYREDPKLRNEDFLLCAEALKAGARFVVSSATLYKYRQRASSISHRVTAAQFAAMLEANAELGLAAHAARASLDPETRERLMAAVGRYDRALASGARFVSLAERLKGGGWRGVLGEAMATPALWPLAARFGTEAIARRLHRLAAPAA